LKRCPESGKPGQKKNKTPVPEKIGGGGGRLFVGVPKGHVNTRKHSFSTLGWDTNWVKNFKRGTDRRDGHPGELFESSALKKRKRKNGESGKIAAGEVAETKGEGGQEKPHRAEPGCLDRRRKEVRANQVFRGARGLVWRGQRGGGLR